VFLLMFRAGLRVGEACALEVSGLDSDEGRVDVPDNPGLTKRGARTTYFDRTDTELRDALTAWLAVREAWKPQTPRLFATRRGGPIEDTTILRQAIRNAAVRAWNNGGLTPQGHRVHTHALRHSFATDAVNRGAPINVIQAALGHERPDMSLRYVRANPRQVKEWFERNPG
jgi:integrase/recombinase XerD